MTHTPIEKLVKANKGLVIGCASVLGLTLILSIYLMISYSSAQSSDKSANRQKDQYTKVYMNILSLRSKYNTQMYLGASGRGAPAKWDKDPKYQEMTKILRRRASDRFTRTNTENMQEVIQKIIITQNRISSLSRSRNQRLKARHFRKMEESITQLTNLALSVKKHHDKKAIRAKDQAGGYTFFFAIVSIFWLIFIGVAAYIARMFWNLNKANFKKSASGISELTEALPTNFLFFDNKSSFLSSESKTSIPFYGIKNAAKSKSHDDDDDDDDDDDNDQNKLPKISRNIIMSMKGIPTAVDFFKAYSDADHNQLNTVKDIFVSNNNSNIKEFIKTLPQQGTIQQDGNITYLKFTYKPFMSDKGIRRLLVMVHDKTKERVLEHANKKQNAYNKRMIHTLKHKSTFKSFCKEIDIFITSVEDEIDKDGPNRKMIKKNLASLSRALVLFHFRDLTDRIKQMEDKWFPEEDDDRVRFKSKDRALWASIKSTWEREKKDLLAIISEQNIDDQKIWIDKSSYKDLLFHLDETGQDSELIDRVTSLTRMKFSSACAKYEKFIEKLSKTNKSKNAKLVFMEGSSDITKEEVDRYDPILMPLLRNCFEHGIESTSDRSDSGKRKIGTIFIKFRRSYSGSLQLVIRDDGQGIKVESVIKQAIKDRLWTRDAADTASKKEKLFLAFKRFVTTNSQKNGLGMTLVQDQIKSYGGKINIVTQAGKGTQFEIEIPGLDQKPKETY